MHILNVLFMSELLISMVFFSIKKVFKINWSDKLLSKAYFHRTFCLFFFFSIVLRMYFFAFLTNLMNSHCIQSVHSAIAVFRSFF